jgi:hypothetical protein
VHAIPGYTLVRELGRGGMGLVYEGRDDSVGRRVAIKLILAADPEALARFGREAELLARIRHPNVIQVHELGRCAEGPFLVTELVEGEELSEWLRRGPTAPRDAAEVVVGLCDAVTTLHAAGVVHRDLKPANVILRPDRTPVLLDFGLAKDPSAEGLTQTGAVMGTPAYMSPEQADGGRAVDVAADVYGLGAILYGLVCGQRPFSESDGVQLIYKVLSSEPDWPQADGLERVLQRAMAKDPSQRYPSAEALKGDLHSFLQGEHGLRPRGGRWVAGLTLLSVALAAAGSVVAWSTRGEPSEGASPAPAASRGESPSAEPVASASGLPVGKLECVQRLRDGDREQMKRGHARMVRYLEDGTLITIQERGSNVTWWTPQDDASLGARRFQERRQSWGVNAAAGWKGRLAVVGNQSAVHMYTLPGEFRRFELPAPLDKVALHAACFSSDGRLLYVGADRGRVGVLEVETGKLVADWQSSDARLPMRVHLGPRGGLIATSTATGGMANPNFLLVVLDPLELKVRARYGLGAADVTALCSWGGQAAVAFRSHALVQFSKGWKLLEGRPYWSHDATLHASFPSYPVPLATREIVRRLRVSQGGHLLYSASGAKGAATGSIQVWDTASRKEKARTERGRNYSDLDLSPDGHYLAAAVWGGPIEIWRLPKRLRDSE